MYKPEKVRMRINRLFTDYRAVAVINCNREDVSKILGYGSDELPFLECVDRLRLEEIQRVESGEKRRILKLSDITKCLGENEVPCEIRDVLLQYELGTPFAQVRKHNGHKRRVS